MISNISGIDGVIDNTTARVFSEGTRAVETEEEARIRRFTGGEVDSPSSNLARYIERMADHYLVNLDVEMVYRLDRFRRGGHHRPFNAVGIPGVRIMETHEHYDRQHQDLRVEDGRAYGDTLDGVDPVYAAKLTSLNAITLAGIAGAPPFPVDVEASGAVRASAKLNGITEATKPPATTWPATACGGARPRRRSGPTRASSATSRLGVHQPRDRQLFLRRVGRREGWQRDAGGLSRSGGRLLAHPSSDTGDVAWAVFEVQHVLPGAAVVLPSSPKPVSQKAPVGAGTRA
jgi:hypothetical protein